MKDRRLQILLICSLAFNVFAIGGVIGAAIVWQRAEVRQPLQGTGRAARLREAAMNLSPEYRRELRSTLRETVRELRPQTVAARAARLEAQRLLTESTLDPDALRAAMQRARDADTAIRVAIESGLIDFAAALPQEERLQLAQALERPRATPEGQGMQRNRRRPASMP